MYPICIACEESIGCQRSHIVEWSSDNESSDVGEIIGEGSMGGLVFKLAFEGWTEIGWESWTGKRSNLDKRFQMRICVIFGLKKILCLD